MKRDILKTIDHVIRTSQQRYKSLDEFAEEVLTEYILSLGQDSYAIDTANSAEVKEEILLEIKEITQKKIYGFYDINEYKEFLTKQDS